MLLRIIKIFIFIILSYYTGYSQTVYIENQDQIKSIAKYSDYYIDQTNQLTIDSIQKPVYNRSFIPCQDEILKFGNDPHNYWIRFTIQNNTSDVCVIEVLKPHIGYISFFEPDEKGIYHEKITGSFVPSSKKEYDHNYIWFRLDRYKHQKKNTPVTCYLKLTSPNKTAPLKAGTEKAMFNEKGKSDMFYGICFGILIMVIFYNLFIYLSIRERVYLMYLLYVFFIAISNAILVGFTPTFLTGDHFNIAIHQQAIIAVAAIFLTLFSMKILDAARKLPFVNFVYAVFLALEFFAIVCDLTKQYYYGSILIQAFTMGSAIFLLPVSITIYFKGNRMVRFYIIAWCIGWVGIISYVLAINSVISFNFFSQNGVLIGSLLESVLFSMALADKINFIKRENELANKRTLEVVLENDKLIKHKNERLEQYIFVTSHNLRGPVARVLGLIYLLKKDKIISGEQEKLILSKLEESTMELDAIIKDIGVLLEIDEESKSMKETISFNELIKKIFLAVNIPSNVAVDMVTDFSKIPVIVTIRPLIYSILYQLIENSIKFRQEDRPLRITIQTRQLRDLSVVIVVTDNAQGIDLNLVSDKIFQPYQRFDLHKEGKGFGLFIVKTQVEALNGEVTVESELGVGTTFSVVIPQRKADNLS
ncbi:MAG TPA: sensor histidine kinase [Cytophagaceae bacterium]|nr:sensor histidine kinase [Cytophagaceae bacterium]